MEEEKVQSQSQMEEQLNRWNKLDRGIAPNTGKRVFYQLRDEELMEADREEPQMYRKVVAFIEKDYGHGRVRLSGTYGGGFTTVTSGNGRQPGEWESCQTEDLGEPRQFEFPS